MNDLCSVPPDPYIRHGKARAFHQSSAHVRPSAPLSFEAARVVAFAVGPGASELTVAQTGRVPGVDGIP